MMPVLSSRGEYRVERTNMTDQNGLREVGRSERMFDRQDRALQAAIVTGQASIRFTALVNGVAAVAVLAGGGGRPGGAGHFARRVGACSSRAADVFFLWRCSFGVCLCPGP